MKVLSMIYKLLQNNKVATKRDLFYEEPHVSKTIFYLHLNLRML